MKHLVVTAILLVACKGGAKPGAALARKYLDAQNVPASFAEATAKLEKTLGPVKVKSDEAWEWADVDGDECWHLVLRKAGDQTAGATAYNAEARNPEPFAKCKAIAEAK